MRKKSKTWIFILVCVVLMTVLCYLAIGNPIVFFHNQGLKRAAGALDNGEIVSLNEIIPFEWDVLYMPAPYQSKAEIEEMIGFKSMDIQENVINEGMVHVLFVKDNKVAASVLGYSDNLGYSIDLSSKKDGKVTYAENAQFLTTKVDGNIMLAYISE